MRGRTCLAVLALAAGVLNGHSQSMLTGDNGDGTFTNPVLWADAPDPSVVRVDSVFYMVSTTMHYSPGCTIMKSVDLVNWSVVGYAHDELEETDAFALKNGASDYASGSWAANIRYDRYEQRFYVIVTCNTTGCSYILTTTDPEHGPWHKSRVDKCYDPGLLFEDTGTECRKWVVHPSDRLDWHAAYVRDLFVDSAGEARVSEPRVIIEYANIENPAQGLRAEGYHGYKIGEYYYVFMIQGVGWQRQQIVWRSKTLTHGSWEVRRIFAGEIIDTDGNAPFAFTGIAQGGIVDTPGGDWYAFLFQDYGAVGRIPVIIPMHWEDDWPVLGDEGKSVAQVLPKPVQGGDPCRLVVSDDFDNGKERHLISDTHASPDIAAGIPAEQLRAWADRGQADTLGVAVDREEYGYNGSNLRVEWQWNHNPNNNLWSLTERPGYLRLKAGIRASDITRARNTLTQRTYGPCCAGEVALETAGMRAGDVAGIAAFQNQYGFVGVTVEEDGRKYVVMRRAREKDDAEGAEMGRIPLEAERVCLRVDCDYRNRRDEARFYYSVDGKNWLPIGDTLSMQFDWPHFVGYRFALFYYATERLGGYADFDYFHTDGHVLADNE